MMTDFDESGIRRAVRGRYAAIAEGGGSCCGPSGSSADGCGCDTATPTPEAVSRGIGYTDREIASVPEGSNMGLGCGNPTALASLRPGEAVLDLGSGGGFDCFLAADRVGEAGRVIGVDMTAEMLELARDNASKGGYGNVEFRLGEIEHLPVADGSIDTVVSNCVVNLSPDKPQVFREAFRALRPGGRLMVSDIVVDGELPEAVRTSLDAYGACIAGASSRADYLRAMGAAGFAAVEVVSEAAFDLEDGQAGTDLLGLAADAGIGAGDVREAVAAVTSISVSAVKPG